MKNLAKNIHWEVLTHFVYTPDKEQFPEFFEHWMSHADEVEAGQTFRDDCDGFALTCAELLVRGGADEGKVSLVRCLTETGGGHLVCMADGWLLDNRQRTAVRWEDIPYTWQKSMKMGEVGIWRKI
jgi:predicted transglutaminase-like cysteine proteinase